jgi:hypothetical protein
MAPNPIAETSSPVFPSFRFCICILSRLYVISSFASFVSPSWGDRLSRLIIPVAILGEGSLTLWLLLKGVDVEKWQRTVTRT